jgi:hypothetical protein
MNRIIFRIFFVLMLINSYSLMSAETNFEVRSAAFFHSSKHFRKIYGKVGANYQMEASIKSPYHCFATWANVDWLTKRGRSERYLGHNKISIGNISLGIKFPYQFSDRMTAYVGIGASLAKIWLKNKGLSHHENHSKLACGGVLKSGIYYYITKCIFVDLFVDYLYQPIHFKKLDDVSGLKTGVGVGVKF